MTTLPEDKGPYYSVPCEFQIRFRPIEAEELKVFSSFSLRPSPHSTLKMQIDTQIERMDIREDSKALFEKAFQILLNIDQRLERLEEQMIAHQTKRPSKLESYDWVHGDLSASGVAFLPTSEIETKIGARLLIDFILPSLPEHRIVAASEVIQKDNAGKLSTRFIAIHEDDREFIHRFVTARERELLRARSSLKKTAPDLFESVLRPHK